MGSNIFFSSKHSLGFPMGSEAMGEIIWVGKTGTGTGTAAGTWMGRAPGWVGVAPLTKGAPGILPQGTYQQGFGLAYNKDITKLKVPKTYLEVIPLRSSFAISITLD